MPTLAKSYLKILSHIHTDPRLPTSNSKMPYAERSAPSSSRLAANKSTTLPMPVAATHNNEERYISSLQSFVRRKCIEYFSNDNIDDDDESSLDTTNTNTNEGRVGLRCTFCNTLAPHLRSAKSCVYPRQTASIAAAILTIQYSHLPYCTEVPEEVMEHMEVLRENDLIKETRAAYNVNNKRKTKKRYRYGDVANEMGFRDIKDDEGEGEGGSNTKKGIIFIPPEESYGRKRQAVVYNDDSQNKLHKRCS